MATNPFEKKDSPIPDFSTPKIEPPKIEPTKTVPAKEIQKPSNQPTKKDKHIWKDGKPFRVKEK